MPSPDAPGRPVGIPSPPAPPVTHAPPAQEEHLTSCIRESDTRRRRTRRKTAKKASRWGGVAINPPVPAAPAPENPDQPAPPAAPAPAAPAPVDPTTPAPPAVTWTSTVSSRVTFPVVQVKDHETSLRERLNLTDSLSPLKETPPPPELTPRLPETEVIRNVHSKKPFCVRPPEETADALATYFAEDRAGTVLALRANLGNL